MKELINLIQDRLGKKIDRAKLFRWLYIHKWNPDKFFYTLMTANQREKEDYYTDLEISEIWEEVL